jgi:two-component system OmpR family sensor kinase
MKLAWPAVLNSLFVKVYLTLLASLAAVAIASAIFVRLGQEEQDMGWHGRRDELVAAMLPAGEDPASLKPTLDRLSHALAADLAVYDASGMLIAGAGHSFPHDILTRRWRYEDDFHVMVIKLPDGRSVAARMPPLFGRRGARNPIAYLAMIAGVIGLAAYPVVRHLTRRLERLRLGVEAWGKGALVTRVADSGNDEVAAVAKSFNRAAGHIERLVAAHGALLANASHELRSPLARLRMAIDLYEQAPDDGRKGEIVRNLAELDALVEEILLASRLDHVDRHDHAEAVDLLALATEEGARNNIEVTGTLATVSGDPQRLSRLVRNLMQNALRHGAPPVTVAISREQDRVHLRVRDHGPGIPESERKRVFEPFYRPLGRSEASGGWGLGLALVRQIAEHHGATTHYESAPDGGACFVVTFPAHKADG